MQLHGEVQQKVLPHPFLGRKCHPFLSANTPDLFSTVLIPYCRMFFWIFNPDHAGKLHQFIIV
jgi:hypothetical protein